MLIRQFTRIIYREIVAGHRIIELSVERTLSGNVCMHSTSNASLMAPHAA